MTAISPCPLATNITATAFISKNIGSKRKVLLSGMLYSLGRAFTYTAIGLVLYFGASRFHIQRFFSQNGEKYLGSLLIIIGLIMLNVIHLAFCPYSGALYFGMLIPMTISSSSGLYLPLVFALGTGLPVMLFSYLLAFSAHRIGGVYQRIQIIEKYMRYIAGIVFILAGVYYVLIFAGVL
jgi:cytochrome c-type biogenesis protein